MTVRELIDRLEDFNDDDMVCIGMIQNYGSNFAIGIDSEINMFEIESFRGKDVKAVVLTECGQFGVVRYE